MGPKCARNSAGNSARSSARNRAPHRGPKWDQNGARNSGPKPCMYCFKLKRHQQITKMSDGTKNSPGHRPIGVLDPLTCIIYRYFILLILYIPVFIYRYFKYRFLSTDNTRAGPALGALTPKSGTTARYSETLWQPLNAHGSIFIDFSSPKSDVEKSTIFRIFKNRRKW